MPENVRGRGGKPKRCISDPISRFPTLINLPSALLARNAMAAALPHMFVDAYTPFPGMAFKLFPRHCCRYLQAQFQFRVPVWRANGVPFPGGRLGFLDLLPFRLVSFGETRWSSPVVIGPITRGVTAAKKLFTLRRSLLPIYLPYPLIHVAPLSSTVASSTRVEATWVFHVLKTAIRSRHSNPIHTPARRLASRPNHQFLGPTATSFTLGQVAESGNQSFSQKGISGLLSANTGDV